MVAAGYAAETTLLPHSRSTPERLEERRQWAPGKDRSHTLYLHFPRFCVIGARLQRERNGKRCAFTPLARHFYFSVMRFHDAVQNRKPKSDALTLRFRRKKWIENL